jgi:hypothetical protein
LGHKNGVCSTRIISRIVELIFEMSAPDKLWRQLFIDQLERQNPRLTHLDLTRGGWWPSRSMMEELCKAMRCSTLLKSLNFRKVPVVSAFPCELFCSSLSGLSCVTSLDLGATGITGANATPFSLLLIFRMPALVSLSLAGNRFTDGCNDSVNTFKNIFAAAASAPQLQHFDLSNTGITFPADRHLFSNFLRQLASLQSPLVCNQKFGQITLIRPFSHRLASISARTRWAQQRALRFRWRLRNISICALFSSSIANFLAAKS